MNARVDQAWDVIVIGTGIGGGTAGRKLAEAGLKVLFVEQGPSGYRAEQTRLDTEMFVPEARLARGFWPTPMTATVDGYESTFYGPLGAGVGGSSVFYAATFERPERHDLDSSNARPHPSGGWPISYDAFTPYMTEAESLYAVRGTQNPLANTPANLAEPAPMNPADSKIFERLQTAGMHPYQLHSAVKNLEGCASCFGHKCPRPCKMDGRSAGVEPALASGNAAILDMAEVTRLDGKAGQITHITARRNGAEITLKAPVVLLAAGAFGSPRLCLASTSEEHPNGIANSSDLVGRGLMFHLNEMFAIWPGIADEAPSKSVGFRDLMWRDNQRLGMVQAMGINASYGEILHYLRLRMSRSALGRNRISQEAARLPAALATKMLGSAKIFSGIMEDLPYEENRVLAPEHGEIRFEYRLHDELRERRRLFRREIKRAFKGQRMMFLSHAPELNFGHPSGTMRFGENPQKAVLRSDGRSHDFNNLYVADASFMPTSMGVNPSLTIAAQALRVAEAIIKGYRQ
ncbi:GMC family oxidoreductase [Lentibacter algarum]|uniref:GMC oxidoreductase n=1 Tax=Lentibacter algarum TaxID=576131 RepID=UPI001C0850B8|nr:GMC family oxidoreductase [Lentibacter algarum]MBU2983334.1 GMC family oxidoreductase [Lentibacter algarum]